YLLCAKTEAPLRSAGPFVARTVAPSIKDGEAFELVAPKAALAGPLAKTARAAFAALRERWIVSDAAERRDHGGRAPDFGDPVPVIDSVSGVATDVVEILESAAVLRLTAALADASPLVRIELVPDVAGRARDFTNELPVGDLAPLLALPRWVQAAGF